MYQKKFFLIIYQIQSYPTINAYAVHQSYFAFIREY